MSNGFFCGVTTALVTPFYQGEVDFESLARLVRFQLDSGIQGFVVSGSTGEAATLTLEEKQALLAFVLSEVSNQVPVIFGSGTNNTKESMELTSKFSASVVNGFLVVAPYYNKPPQRGMVEHFKKIASVTAKPIVIYNVPGRTVVSMDVNTVKELSRVENIVAIKEASGKIPLVKAVVKAVPKDFTVLSGDDETFLKAAAVGARGVISVVSHVAPKFCLSAKKSDQKKLTALSQAIFCESNPIPVKWALKEMGILRSAEVRLPLVEMDSKFAPKVKKALKSVGAL